MSQLLPPATRRELERLRLLPKSARAHVGVGDRRSAQVGPGMEFEDFRAYQAGDDIRYVDRHVLARLGQRVVRQYSVDRQLEVTVILDASGSMNIGNGEKFRTGKQLCAVISYLTLRGGDRIRLGFAQGPRVAWQPVVTAEFGLGELLTRLDEVRAGGEVGIGRIASLGASTRNAGLLVVVSDWLMEDAVSAIRSWTRRWGEVVGVQILDETDRDPELLDLGSAIRDLETGETLNVFGDDLNKRYVTELAAWGLTLKKELRSGGGTWLEVPAGGGTSSLISSLRAARLIG